jgi:hypothetical protein
MLSKSLSGQPAKAETIGGDMIGRATKGAVQGSSSLVLYAGDRA